MENASKALLIAGAILLSILIISLGLMAYNQAKNTVGSSNLSKQEIEAFNSEWEKYQGSNKTANEVKSVFSALIAHNASETKLGTKRTVKIVCNAKVLTSTSTAINGNPTSVPEVDSSKTYTMTPTYDSTSGLITSITIS